jgi:hypothetical protein
MGEAKRRRAALGNMSKLVGVISSQALIEAASTGLPRRFTALPTLEHEKWPLFIGFDEASKIPDSVWQERFPPGGADAYKARCLNMKPDEFAREFMGQFPPDPTELVIRDTGLRAFLEEQERLRAEHYDPVALEAEHAQYKRGFGRKNIYRCNQCGHEMITCDAATGVTPFVTACPECNGDTTSQFYRVDQTLTETHEWFRPETLDGLSPYSIDHVRRGGLILRKIEKHEPKQASEH